MVWALFLEDYMVKSGIKCVDINCHVEVILRCLISSLVLINQVGVEVIGQEPNEAHRSVLIFSGRTHGPLVEKIGTCPNPCHGGGRGP